MNKQGCCEDKLDTICKRAGLAAHADGMLSSSLLVPATDLDHVLSSLQSLQ